MTNRKKEIAKFFCGFEAFHTFSHTYFWLSGTTLKLLWFTETPTLHMAGAIVNGIIALVLGIYGWKSSASRIS